MTDQAAGSLFSPSALAQDFRFARRMFVKKPLFSMVVVVTLAIGIGLNTAVFSAVEAMLLRPLPGVSAPEELVQLYETAPGAERFNKVSFPQYFDLRDRTKRVFSGVAGGAFQFINITADGPPQQVVAQVVSANYFSVLGVQAERGRFFTPDEDVGEGAHPVAILSHGAWKSLFASDPKVIGRSIPVNGQPMTIIGVAPAAFNGTLPMVQPVLWVPIMQMPQVLPSRGAADLKDRGTSYNDVFARLAPGVTVEQARVRLTALEKELLAEHPDSYKGLGINMVPQAEVGIHPSLRVAQVGLSAVVMAVVVILLIIACVNVANLFLARARDRSREMAVRLALGARRSALLRQLLVESLVFSLVAGAAGMLVAYWAITIANGITLPYNVTFSPDLRLSPRVLGFALGITALTSLLAGVVPALQATRPSLIPALKGETPAGASRSRMSKGLVIAQMALSMILLVCAALFLVNLRGATAMDKGFKGDNILLADLDPGLQGYTRPRAAEFYRELLARLRENPQVASVATIDRMPLGLNSSQQGVTIPDYTPTNNEGMSIGVAITSPGYFSAMGIAMRAGREFTAQDDSGAAPAVIVNQRFVDRFWPGKEALGRAVRAEGVEYTVIGVVPTAKYARLGEDPTAFMWHAQAQKWTAEMTLIVRTKSDPTAFIPTLRREIASRDQNLPVSNVRTMEKHLGISLLPARVAGTALGVFGLLGLLLAAVGMYGVMAYSVSQRTREIGIRMAIGASTGEVVRLIMRQGLSLVLIGTAIGLAGAIAASRLLASVLYGNDALSPLTFIVVPLVLIGVAALATFVPARRASRVNPAITIRAE